MELQAAGLRANGLDWDCGVREAIPMIRLTPKDEHPLLPLTGRLHASRLVAYG